MKSALFLLLPATALLYYPFAFEEFETPKAYALVAFGCFSFFFVQWKEILKDRVAQALLLFTVSAAVSTIFSIDWHMSLFGNPKCPMGLLVIVSYLTVYLAAVRVLKRPKIARQAVDVILACSAVVAFYAIAQAMGYDFKKWTGVAPDHEYMRPISTLGHANFMANYLAMTLPFSLLRQNKFRYCFLSATLLLAIFLSLSRGMIIATICSMSVFYFLTGQCRRATKVILVAAIAILVSLAAFPGFKLTAERRMDALVSPGPARVEYPKGAVRIWKRSPLIGVGTDVFELGFQNERTPHYWQIERGGSPHRAHNDFLNILATQGLFGALAAILLTIAAIFRARRTRSIFAPPAIAAISAFYVAGLTSFTVVATGVLFMVCLALLRTE